MLSRAIVTWLKMCAHELCEKKRCQIIHNKVVDEIYGMLLLKVGSFYSPRRNLNYFSNAYAAAVSAVDPDAGNGELCIKVPSELWKHVDGKASGI